MSNLTPRLHSSEPISWSDEHAGILVVTSVFIAILLAVAVLAVKQYFKDKNERGRYNYLERQDLRGGAVELEGMENGIGDESYGICLSFSGYNFWKWVICELWEV
ncbi:hypothetical protein BZA77DRAFT_348984 [Pyronema omphalodes]|nr:hypothetical protein BZA77DRAFT_348984 [Pyronema omphalodes]